MRYPSGRGSWARALQPQTNDWARSSWTFAATIVSFSGRPTAARASTTPASWRSNAALLRPRAREQCSCGRSPSLQQSPRAVWLRGAAARAHSTADWLTDATRFAPLPQVEPGGNWSDFDWCNQFLQTAHELATATTDVVVRAAAQVRPPSQPPVAGPCPHLRSPSLRLAACSPLTHPLPIPPPAPYPEHRLPRAPPLPAAPHQGGALHRPGSRGGHLRLLRGDRAVRRPPRRRDHRLHHALHAAAPRQGDDRPRGALPRPRGHRWVAGARLRPARSLAFVVFSSPALLRPPGRPNLRGPPLPRPAGIDLCGEETDYPLAPFVDVRAPPPRPPLRPPCVSAACLGQRTSPETPTLERAAPHMSCAPPPAPQALVRATNVGLGITLHVGETSDGASPPAAAPLPAALPYPLSSSPTDPLSAACPNRVRSGPDGPGGGARALPKAHPHQPRDPDGSRAKHDCARPAPAPGSPPAALVSARGLTAPPRRPAGGRGRDEAHCGDVPHQRRPAGARPAPTLARNTPLPPLPGANTGSALLVRLLRKRPPAIDALPPKSHRRASRTALSGTPTTPCGASSRPG